MRTHRDFVFNRKGIVSLCAALVVAGVLVLPGRGVATIVTLNDSGSSATINLDSSAGMFNWSVDGQDQLNQQWFWYRTDGGIARPINTIGTASYTTYTGSDGINEVVATYANSQLQLTIDYFLQGGGVGSGNADMTEGITIKNLTTSSLSLNFYQYSDFNLLGDGSSDNVQLFGIGNPEPFYYVRQWTGSTAIQEGIVSPCADYGEAAYVGTTLTKLNGAPGLVLDNTTGAGPGDVTWAFQWTANVAPGNVFDLSKDKSLSIQIVPEPSNMALIALGLSALGLAQRRKTS
jgi:hypothetical protein